MNEIGVAENTIDDKIADEKQSEIIIQKWV